MVSARCPEACRMNPGRRIAGVRSQQTRLQGEPVTVRGASKKVSYSFPIVPSGRNSVFGTPSQGIKPW